MPECRESACRFDAVSTTVLKLYGVCRVTDKGPNPTPGAENPPAPVWAVVVEYRSDFVLVCARKFDPAVIRKLDQLFGADVAGTRVLLKARGPSVDEQLMEEGEEGFVQRVKHPPAILRLLGFTLERRVEHAIQRCRRWCKALNQE